MALYYFWYLDSLFEIAEKFDVADCTVKRSVDAVSGELVSFSAKVTNSLYTFQVLLFGK